MLKKNNFKYFLIDFFFLLLLSTVTQNKTYILLLMSESVQLEGRKALQGDLDRLDAAHP